jgi:hypothetical protein
MSSILSERNKHSGEAAAIILRKIAEEIAKSKQESLSNLDTVDIRGKGGFSTSLIKYNDERFAYRKLVPTNKTNFELPFEPNTRYLKLWYMMDHKGPQILDLSGLSHNGELEGHPTLTSVPVDLGIDQWSTEPKSSAMNFNTGTDSISALQGELIVIPDYNILRVLTNDPIYPTHKKFSISFRFLSTTYAADTANGGNIFRRFATKRDDPNNGWLAAFDSGGDLVFFVFQDGIWYQCKVDNLDTHTIYEAVLTYDESKGSTNLDRIGIYVHKYTDPIPDEPENLAVDDSGSSFLLPPVTETKMFIGGRSARDGYLKGWLQDFRLYVPDYRVENRQVLTTQEIKHWWTNKLTIQDTPFGNVAVIGQFNLSLEEYNIIDIPPAALSRTFYHGYT